MVTKTVKVKAPDTKAMDRFMDKFGSDFGQGIGKGGEDVPYDLDVIPTGSMLLDYRLGCGGFPVGRVSELWGMPGSCKTTTTMLTIAQMQRKWPDRYAAFIDVENSFNRKWAEAHGVDMSRLKVFDGIKTAEVVSDIAYRLAGEEMFGLVVLDSIGAMIPKEEFTKMAEEATVGTTAKIITRLVKKIASTIPLTHQVFLPINQVRAIVGPKGGMTTGGGFGLKHVSSVQLKYSETGTNLTVSANKTTEVVGKEINIKSVKNKMAPPNQNARPTFIQRPTDKHGPVGIDFLGELLDVGKASGVIARAGSWITLPNGERFGSTDKGREYLTEHPQAVDEIRAAIMETVKHTVHDDMPTRPESEFDEDVATLDAIDLDEVTEDVDA